MYQISRFRAAPSARNDNDVECIGSVRNDSDVECIGVTRHDRDVMYVGCARRSGIGTAVFMKCDNVKNI